MQIYNTMTRKKEVFQPRDENRIKLFVCGPTVYDDSHIGHARTYISFDIIARYFKFKGFSIFYLQNITDVDDKIIKRASEIGVEPIKLARKFEKRYLEDMDILGVSNVNYYARATEHIPEIIDQIKTLMEKGFAYQTENGVYFDESLFADFGKLSHRNIEDLNVHRIVKDSNKRNPGDFALWKRKEDGPNWDSPWGKGRPGWHIEDTAITEEYLGPCYDIHGGGLDLIFPHHEAEIAQMESASGEKPMAGYWMHTGFLNVEGEKMSKSLDNFITIRDLLQDYSPDVFRFFVLSTHYRSPIDFSKAALKQSENSLLRIRKFMETILNGEEFPQTSVEDATHLDHLKKFKQEFFDGMDNDFNTPDALAVVFNLIRYLNRAMDDKTVSNNFIAHILSFFMDMGRIFGIDFTPRSYHDNKSNEILEVLVEVRKCLRNKKDWELADFIRSRLKDLDILLEDK